jgi:hypothetical protein
MPSALNYCPVCLGDHGCKVIPDKYCTDGSTSFVICNFGSDDTEYKEIPNSSDWTTYIVPTKDIDFTKSKSYKYNNRGSEREKPHTDPLWQQWLKLKPRPFTPGGKTEKLILERGLTLEYAQEQGFREILLSSYQQFFVKPKNGQKNLPHWVREGTFIPMRNVSGEIVHGQLRPHEVSEGSAKYVWQQLHNENGDQYRYPESFNYFGSKPGNFLKGESLSDVCLVCEGALKSHVVYSNLQRKYHVYGASGGAWASNAQYLKELSLALKNMGVTKMLLLPDSNSRANPGVWKSIIKFERWCLENNFQFILGDWGQLDQKLENQDPDEIPINQLSAIVRAQGKLKNPAELLAIKEIKGPFTTKLLVDKADNELDLQQWLADLLPSNHKYHLLNTPMGTGKSWIVETLHKNFDVNVVYISQSPRDLPTEYLARNAYVPPARHGGLVNTGRKDPLGNNIYRRPKSDKEETHSPATCLKHVEHNLALKNGVPPAKICKDCPAFHGCLDGSDPDYTYLHDKIQGIKNTTLIATSVAGFSEKLIPDNGKQTFIVVDEASQNMQPLEIIDLTAEEFAALDKRFFFDVDSVGHFVCSVAPTLTDVEDAEAVDASNLQRAMRNQGKVTKYGKLVKGLIGNGYIQMEGTRRQLICRSTQISKILEYDALRVILMDATASKSVLEAELNITLREYSANDLSTNSVEIQVFLHPGAKKFQITPEALDFAKTIKRKDWTLIGSCQSVGKDGIGFFRDSRGSNAAQESKGLVIAGLPLPNIGGIRLKYSVLENPTITFNDYYQAHVQAELLQAVGRIRGYRRQTEKLVCRIVCHSNLDWLSTYGYQVSYRAVPELSQQYSCFFQNQQSVPTHQWSQPEQNFVSAQAVVKLAHYIQTAVPLCEKAMSFGLKLLGTAKSYAREFGDFRPRFIEMVKEAIAERQELCYS